MFFQRHCLPTNFGVSPPLHGAEKLQLQWSVGEAEVDAERAGCFAEQQLRLGLVVDGATPEIRDRFGRPMERTTEPSRTRIGAVHPAVHGEMGRGCTAPATGRAPHLSPRGCRRPQERQSGRLHKRNIVSRLPVLVFGVAVLNFLYRDVPRTAVVYGRLIVYGGLCMVHGT